MTTNVYKLTSPSLPGGAVYFCYRDGRLSAFDAADASPTEQQLRWILQQAPINEAELEGITWGSGVFQLIPAKTAKDKLILFAQYFKSYRGVTYVATQVERSNIRTVPVTPDLLRTFFESPLDNFGIANYIRRINLTKDQLKNGAGPRFPAHYSAKFEKELSEDQQRAYHAHLKKLGWKYDYGPAGSLWKPPVRVADGA